MNEKISEELIDQIRSNFKKWAKSDQSNAFSARQLLISLSKPLQEQYGNRLLKKPGFWALCLAEADINPDIIVSSKFKDLSSAQAALAESIIELEENIGIENLNDGSMNKTKEFIDLPLPLRRYRGVYKLSDHLKIYPTISKAAFQRRCMKVFGSWDRALEYAGINLSDVKRKIAKHSSRELLDRFNQFIINQTDDWSVSTLRDTDYELFRAIGNSSKNNKIKFPYSEVSTQYVFALWVWWKSWKETGEYEVVEDWWKNSESRLRQDWSDHHSVFENWSSQKIQHQVLTLYSEGSNLDRSDLQSRNKGPLLSALRSRSPSGGEAKYISSVGIFTDKLSNLNRIINDLSLQEVSQSLRNLVGESLREQRNLLSREEMQKNNPEILSSAIRWYSRMNKDTDVSNDWSRTLEFFGLNPAVFELSQSKRTKRGIIFQRFVEDLLRIDFEVVDNPESVKNEMQVCFDRFYDKSTCLHDTRCRPDFVFKDMIIDTKTGGALGKPDQLSRYLGHKEKLILLTLNDKEKTILVEEREVRIINFKDFIGQSSEIIGVQLPESAISELSEIMKIRSLYAPVMVE